MFVLSMLKSDAVFWWDAETGGKGSSSAKEMTWETFVGKFKAEFCPLAAIKKLEEEFLNLEQKEMTVREYTSKFIEKSRFAELYVPTEERRVERYIYRLKSSIRELVSTRNPTTFQAAINAAELTEKEKNRQVTERVGEKRKWEGPRSDAGKGKTFRPEVRGNRGGGDKPCGKCHRVHRGEFLADTRSCFQCGLPISYVKGLSEQEVVLPVRVT